MSPRTIKRATRQPRDSVQSVVAGGGISKILESTGRMPSLEMVVTPIDGMPQISLNRFLTYRFNSSIIVPVDSFDFTFQAPDDPVPFPNQVKDGDIVSLFASNVQIATGIIDTTDVEVDERYGEMVAVAGRDLMGQLEDHDAISFDDKPIRASAYSASQVIQLITRNTRISKFQLQKANSAAALFATEPGESKLAALQRYMEPLNCVAWMSPKGALIYGKPNMSQVKKGTLTLSKSRRESNVLSMKATRASSTIPNLIVGCWSGQEEVQDRVEPRQRLYNRAQRPALLRGYGHIVSKSIVTSTPDATTAQGLSGVNALSAGSSDFLQGYVKREFARRNMDELKVQAVVPGHFNDAGEPFVTDTIYEIQFDRGSVNELMYLYSVEYELTLERGQITKLGFCRLGTIVADNAGA